MNSLNGKDPTVQHHIREKYYSHDPPIKSREKKRNPRNTKRTHLNERGHFFR